MNQGSLPQKYSLVTTTEAMKLNCGKRGNNYKNFFFFLIIFIVVLCQVLLALTSVPILYKNSFDEKNISDSQKYGEIDTFSKAPYSHLRRATSSNTTTSHTNLEEKHNIAQKIIQNSYKDTYQLLESCPKNENFQKCLHNIAQNLSAASILNKNRNYPWWFQTLLRDGTKFEVFLDGYWHTLQSEKLEMCTIEKVAITQWRKVFCQLNYPSKPRRGICKPPLTNSTTKTIKKTSFIFLRDPLERFLSAYLNKCTKVKSDNYNHCQPNSKLSSELDPIRNLNSFSSTSFLKKVLFESYVDTMPLKWNVHFFPQALYCDGLFRHLPNYDFVGYMKQEFYKELRLIGNRYGEPFKSIVQTTFSVPALIKKDEKQKEDVFMGVQTAAPKHVKDYYTSRSLQRVLEYVSIDYLFLNMSVPQWAIEMLEEEYELGKHCL